MKTLRRTFYLWRRRLRGLDEETFAPHGIPVRVPRSADVHVRYLLARGRPYEAPEARMVRRHLAPGMHVVELGGCMGIVSATIRDRIGPEARHVVVEALPHLAEICRGNAARGAAPGATEVVVAAIDYSGAASVRFSTGGNAHEGHVGAGRGASVEVPTTTLARVAERIPEGPFALVCDVEGAEDTLVERERALLARISTLVLETHPRAYADGARTLERMLARIAACGLALVDAEERVYCFVRGRR